MATHCANCHSYGEHTQPIPSDPNGKAVICETCYDRVYFLPQMHAERDGAKAVAKFHATKNYIQQCLRPEILVKVQALLFLLGVPDIKPKDS